MRIINYMCIHIFVHTYLALPPMGRMVRPPPSLGLGGAGVMRRSECVGRASDSSFICTFFFEILR